MKDLIVQLRKDAHHHIDGQMAGLMDEAADAIEKLEAKLESYESAFLQVRVAMGLGLHSHDDLVEYAEKLQAENTQLKAELAAMRDQKPCATVSPYEVNTIFWEVGFEHVGLNSALYAAPGAKP